MIIEACGSPLSGMSLFLSSYHRQKIIVGVDITTVTRPGDFHNVVLVVEIMALKVSVITHRIFA